MRNFLFSLLVLVSIIHGLHLQPPFLQGRRDGQEEWVMGGTASTQEDRIRLTNLENSQKGSLWSIFPNTMPEWEIDFEIQVFGGKGSGADGMAFWYTRVPQLIGDVYGNGDRWDGLAVIFDTYDNRGKRQNPSILAVMNNGTLEYDHANDGVTQQVAGYGPIKFRRDLPFSVRVIYANRTLSVGTTIGIPGLANAAYTTLSGGVEDRTQYTTCFVVDNIDLPTGYYFGFSAATGGLTDNHDVISFRQGQVLHRHPPPSSKQSGPIDVTTNQPRRSGRDDRQTDARVPPPPVREPLSSSQRDYQQPPTTQITSPIDLTELKSLKSRLSSLTSKLDSLSPSISSLQQTASYDPANQLTSSIPPDAATQESFSAKVSSLKTLMNEPETAEISAVTKIVGEMKMPKVPSPPSSLQDAVKTIKDSSNRIVGQRVKFVQDITNGVQEQLNKVQLADKTGVFRIVMFSLVVIGVALMIRANSERKRQRRLGY
ncbi:putative ERGIC-53 like protein [Blattamonas nauphoetae]|uniref:ERGIC-53 like protein n=1 Tax=Blattamonas nauphoetae TaxID=2049346 RepID=A0ABQ9YCI6_9EUKA|nr:putative ERGIC-53 like protein [Blattamonas nauphoetae]